MSKVFIEEETLIGIGNAIREKSGTTDLIATTNMATAINNLATSGGESKSYHIANINILTDADIAMLNKWNKNPPYDWHISTGLGIVSNVYQNMAYGGRVEYTIDNGKNLYEYYHYGSDRYMSYIRGVSLATTSYVQDAIANASGEWNFTDDINDSNLYNAKEIYIHCMDSNNGYEIFSYVVYGDGDILGNHTWNNYYTFSVASGADASYWMYDGSSIVIDGTQGVILIGYKL